jgi:isocitrate dehydrogenase
VLVQPDSKGKWGIVTKRDVMTKIIQANRSPADVKVADVATSPVKTVSPETSLHQCVDMMTTQKIRRVVVEKGGVPIGIVSDTDIFRTVEKFGWTPDRR